MNATDYIAMVLVVVALWGLTTAYPNYRKAKRYQAKLKREKINGYNERNARARTRTQRNILVALVWTFVLAVLVASPTIRIWDTTVSGLWLTLGLILGVFAIALWSRAERDDGEQAHVDLVKLAEKRIREMEGKEDGS